MHHLLIAQVRFLEAPEGFQTARAIIAHKIRNQRGVLGKYRQSIKRAEQETLLQHTNRVIFALKQYEDAAVYTNIPDKKHLLLLEARAAKQYWTMFGLLAGQAEWRRNHTPGAVNDSINTTLNIGYHYLSISIKKAIVQSGLSPDIGLLHANTKEDALVYDLMELWRQPLVDMVILNRLRRTPLFCEHDNWVAILCSDIKKILETKRWRYHGKCIIIQEIVNHELRCFISAMQQTKVWNPAPYLWGRSRYCK